MDGGPPPPSGSKILTAVEVYLPVNPGGQPKNERGTGEAAKRTECALSAFGLKQPARLVQALAAAGGDGRRGGKPPTESRASAPFCPSSSCPGETRPVCVFFTGHYMCM